MRLRLAIAAALLATVATSADAKSSRHPAPKPSVAQCMTDTECEARFGAGDWFPHRQQPATPEPEAEVGTRHWVSGSKRPIWAIPQTRIARRT
jgi:hypothetical protein